MTKERMTENASCARGNAKRITNIKEFAYAVKDFLEREISSARVEIVEVKKNNGRMRTGIAVCKNGCNIAPNIYMEELFERYQNGESLTELYQIIEKILHDVSPKENFNVDSIMDFQSVKGKICFKLINAERNADQLEEMPHRCFHDLAIVYYIMVSQETSDIATIAVKNSMMENWGVDESVLYKTALHNTPKLCRSEIMTMEKALDGFLKPGIIGVPSLYVVTNEKRTNGAGVMLYDGIMEEVAKKTGSDLYILPSSIHETLFLPATNQEDENMLLNMVREVNESCLSQEDYLSDNVYHYHADDGRVTMVC